MLVTIFYIAINAKFIDFLALLYIIPRILDKEAITSIVIAKVI